MQQHANAAEEATNNKNKKKKTTDNELPRFLLLHIGYLCNVLALLLTSYACLALSFQYWLVSKAALEEITITERMYQCNNDQTNPMYDAVILSYETITTVLTGIRGLGFAATNENSNGAVIGYDSFCATSDADWLPSVVATFGMNEDNEDPAWSCEENGNSSSNTNCTNYFSMNATIALLISVAFFFPTFFMAQTRMYYGYDINCIKNCLFLMGMVPILLNINIIVSYFYLCARRSFTSGTYSYNGLTYEEIITGGSSDRTPAEMCQLSELDFYLQVDYTLKWSWGLICLVTGTALKAVDVLCNLLVATPSVTRDMNEQEVYEQLIILPATTNNTNTM